MTVEVIVTSVSVGFVLGVFFSEYRAKVKHDKRHERRQKIIKKRDDIIDEISRWEVNHPKPLLMLPERCPGVVTIKGIDNISSRAFKQLSESMKKTAVGFKKFEETIRRLIDGQD